MAGSFVDFLDQHWQAISKTLTLLARADDLAQELRPTPEHDDADDAIDAEEPLAKQDRRP